MGELKIETVTAAHFEAVLELIGQYQIFYGAQPDVLKNRAHFKQLIDSHDRGILFCALDGRLVSGFATLYFNLASVNPGVACLLNDLYCLPELRGKGTGRALIDHCRKYARSRGFLEMEWQTHQDNKVAQRLYDSMNAKKDSWYTYTLMTS